MLRLAPTSITAGDGTALTLASTIARSGYSVTVNGNAPPAALLLPSRYLPQLGDGVADVLPSSAAGLMPIRVQFTCSRSWTEPQVCAESPSTSITHGAADGTPAAR